MKLKTSLINGKLLRDTLKRFWGVGFVLLLVFFFSITIASTFSVRSFIRDENMVGLTRFCAEFFYQEGNAWVTDGVLAMIAGAAAGIVFYVYLHSKRTVDFFHGQPIRRETLLCTRYIAGLILFALPYLLNLLAAYAILLGYGASPAVIGGVFMRFGFGLLAYALLLAFSALSAVLTGNTFAHLQTGFILCFGGFFLFSVLIWFAQSYLKSFSQISSQWMFYGSAPVLMIERLAETQFGLGWALVYILLTGLTLAFTLWLYQRRPSEAAGAMFAFPAAEPVYRAILTVLLGNIMGSVFFDSTDASLPFTLFGTFLGMFIAHIFCQGQYKRGFRGMFSNWKPLAFTAAAYVLVMFAFLFDVTGYDQYLPAADEVKEVAVQIGGYDGDAYVPTENGETERRDLLEFRRFTGDAVKKDILAFAAGGIESNNALAKKGDEAPAGVNTINMTIRYTLQNGRQVQRDYPVIPMNMIGAELGDMMTDPEYTAKDTLMLYDVLHCNYISVYSDGEDNYHYAANKAEKTALFEAYKADYLENGTPVDETPLAWVETEFQYGRNYVSQTNYVYSGYTRTLGIIEGWNLRLREPDEELIAETARIDVTEAGDYSARLSIDDPAKIRSILSSDQLINNCPPVTLTESYVIQVYSEEDLARINENMDAEKERAAVNAIDAIAYEEMFYKYGGPSREYRILKGGLEKMGVSFKAN